MRNPLLVTLLALLATGNLLAQEEFAPAVRILSGGEPIDVNGYRSARPFVGDFDGDGLNDLLVRQDEDSRLRIYRNRGTNEQPRFDGYELFRINGEIAELPGGGEFRPQLVDFDGDGALDIITSSEPGYIFWYRRKADGSFSEAEMIKLANGKVLNAGRFAACHAVDWEDDGDTDLILVGQRNPDTPGSEVAFVKNTGSAGAPSLSPPTRLMVSDGPIQFRQIYCFPFVADWNGDGHQDLLIGLSNGSVVLYESKGDGPGPSLAPPREVVPAPMGRQLADEEGAIARGRGGCLCLIDWDSDGTLDILIGDQQIETIQPKLTDEKEQLEKTRQEAAQVLRKYRQMHGLIGKLDEITQRKQIEFVQRYRKKYAGQIKALRAEIARLELAMQPESVRHSYIWLLRKTPD